MVKGYLPLALITIIGARDQKVNFTTIGDVAIAGLKPKLIMISVHADHYITGQIRKSKCFSVNVPGMDMLELVKYCSEHTGHKTDKSRLPHELYKDIPYLPQAGQVHFCHVVSETRHKSRVVYLAEVSETLDNTMTDVIIYTLDHKFHKFPL